MVGSYEDIKGCLTVKDGIYQSVISYYVIVNGKRIRKLKSQTTQLKAIPKNKKKAEEIKENRVYEFSNGHSFVDNNIVMKDYVKRFLESKKRDIADTTYSGYMNKCKYINNYFSDVKVNSVTTMQVNAFLDYLITEGTIKENAKNKGLSVRTVKDVKAILNTIFETAKEESIIAVNPCIKATINKKNVRNKERKQEETIFFDYEECLKFIDAIREHKLYYLFYFTLFFGLRREEVLGLKWDSINFTEKQLTIYSTVTKGTKVNYEDATKTNKSYRTYELSDKQYIILKDIFNRKEQYKKLFGNEYNDTEYIFTHEDGTLYHPDSISKIFKKIIKSVPELPQNITMHGLRYSCVSLLVHDNRSLKEIQDWVGHEDATTTLKYYAKIKSRESKKNVSNRLDELLPI